MKHAVVGPVPQQSNKRAVADEIAALFKHTGEVHSQPRLRGITGVCRFDITGIGVWSVATNDGEITVIEGTGRAPAADCVVSCSAEDFLRVVRHEHYMNLVTAAMQGLVTVSGDKVFAMEFLGNVVTAPIVASRQPVATEGDDHGQ